MSRRRFSVCLCRPPPSDEALWEAFGLLAKWFHFQPSEIRELEWGEFERWVALAAKQVKAAGKAP
ncbi:MAG: hypothetical protein LBE33_03885 [Zoogloeaceae bacterium]|jgi:hypothetical protein|nr:hypothetical protein [Zoogloeaceae bacterium]